MKTTNKGTFMKFIYITLIMCTACTIQDDVISLQKLKEQCVSSKLAFESLAAKAPTEAMTEFQKRCEEQGFWK